MLRFKTSKQALIIAALVILLCLVCLTGATFALFTSDIHDGTIGVVATSGQIDVDIVDTTPQNETLVGKTLEFQTTAGNKEVIFEPGAVFFTQGFKIKNDGNIPIKFRLAVSEDKKIDMEEFHSAFELWLSTTTQSTDGAQKLSEFIGELDPEKLSDDTYYLFIRMKETAGNEFQGKSYSGIGVTVYAVQGNADIKEQK